MSAKVFFSNNDGECRLDITHKDGHHQHVLFEKTSSLVNYCNKVGIEANIYDCSVED